MLVRSVMSAPVETVDGGDSCAAVWQLFQDRGLRRAPVVEAGRVIGMVTDRDLYRVIAHTIEALELGDDHSSYKLEVHSVIARQVLSVAPNDRVEQAAQLMLRSKIGGVPVIDSSGPHPELVGILTESDIFRLFVRRTLMQRGHRLVLRAPARGLSELDPAAICVKARVRLYDLSLYPLEGDRAAVNLQVRTDDIEALIERFLVAGYEYVLAEEN